jgi:hypothetical protein
MMADSSALKRAEESERACGVLSSKRSDSWSPSKEANATEETWDEESRARILMV